MDGGAALHFPLEPPEDGGWAEVAPGVLWIRMPMPGPLKHVNVYALDDDDGWTVIDTGLWNDRNLTIWDGLLSGVLAGKPLRRVIVTHHHPDHVGLAGWLAGQGAEIWATRTAWLMARMMTLDEQERPTEQTLAFWRAAGMDPEIYAQRETERPFNFADVVWPIPLGYRRIAQGDMLEAGGRRWQVHVGHGHAPEHATLWSVEGDLVLAGDQVLPGISSNLGVYATEPDADPVGDWLESCGRLSKLANDAQLALPGHRLPFRGLPLRLEQLIDNHHGALSRLREHLADVPRTAHDCFAPLYKRTIRSGEYGLALVEAVGHLNHLHHMGEVTRERREDGAWLWRLRTDR